MVPAAPDICNYLGGAGIFTITTSFLYDKPLGLPSSPSLPSVSLLLIDVSDSQSHLLLHSPPPPYKTDRYIGQSGLKKKPLLRNALPLIPRQHTHCATSRLALRHLVFHAGYGGDWPLYVSTHQHSLRSRLP